MSVKLRDNVLFHEKLFQMMMTRTIRIDPEGSQLAVVV